MYRKKIEWHKIITFIVLSIIAFITLIPFVYALMTATKSKLEYMKNPFGLPIDFVMTNFKVITENFDIPLLTYNSIKVAVISVFISVILTSMAGFSIAKLKFKGKAFIFGLIGFCMIVPGQVTFIPVYGLLSKMGLVNTHLGLIIQYASSSIPMSTFLMAANCRTIDDAMLESAKIDGAGYIRIYLSIIMPLLAPTVATVIILNFISYWNEMFYAMILLQKEALRTMTVAVLTMGGRYGNNIPLLYAGLALNCIPVIIIFLLFQKQLIKGVTDGAVK